jgi:hypothetical protein
LKSMINFFIISISSHYELKQSLQINYGMSTF